MDFEIFYNRLITKARKYGMLLISREEAKKLYLAIHVYNEWLDDTIKSSSKKMMKQLKEKGLI